MPPAYPFTEYNIYFTLISQISPQTYLIFFQEKLLVFFCFVRVTVMWKRIEEERSALSVVFLPSRLTLYLRMYRILKGMQISKKAQRHASEKMHLGTEPTNLLAPAQSVFFFSSPLPSFQPPVLLLSHSISALFPEDAPSAAGDTFSHLRGGELNTRLSLQRREKSGFLSSRLNNCPLGSNSASLSLSERLFCKSLLFCDTRAPLKHPL